MESVAVAWGEQREVSHRRHQVQVLHKAPENECVSRDAAVKKRSEAKTGSSKTWSWRWRRSFLAEDVHARCCRCMRCQTTRSASKCRKAGRNAPLGRGRTAHRAGGSRTFLADAVCWGWLASARMAKPPAEEGPETKFLIRCIAFTWLPLTGARTRREGVVESFSMSDACCLATGSAAACGCCLFDEPMRKTLLSIVAREKRPGRGAARAGWPLSEAVGGDSVSAEGPSLGASACAARCCSWRR